MSTAIAPGESSVEATTSTPASSRPRPRSASLVWAVLACLMLGGSGAIRTVQERRHQFEMAQKDDCPIDVLKIPNQIGKDWKLIKGGERQLDPLTMRITGGSTHVIRTYANEMTGVYVTVLMLFGPADPVLPHTPQVCYPASGYQLGDPPASRTVSYEVGTDDQGQPIEAQAEFLSASYVKSGGRVTLREAVYHSFRLDGQWSSMIGRDRKFPRRNPGIFKIQVQRMEAEGEKLEKGDPLEQFLQSFLTEIEAEIRTASKKSKAGEGAPKKDVASR